MSLHDNTNESFTSDELTSRKDSVVVNSSRTASDTHSLPISLDEILKRELPQVYLVGAGPGDPGLLTLHAKELIETADILIYDYLASDAVMRFAPESAKKIFVGKKGFSNHVTQDDINACLVEEATKHPRARIVRLKGGDPFVFGRGGEEALALTAAGIAFSEVPGITAGVAACAYAGIPVTHRTCASSVTLITGHETPDKETPTINWEFLAQGSDTLCFYMGVRDLPHIVEKLTRGGRPSDTPVALVRWGTTPMQETLTSTLGEVVADVERAQFKAPAIIVVGEVVSLAHTLSWFERRPLFGKTIAVTRTREQASELVRALCALGARVIEFPTISIVARAGLAKDIEARGDLSRYDWIVFTSTNGVRVFFDEFYKLGRDARDLGGVRICAIGPATARELKRFGLNADLVPPRFIAESVVEALFDYGVGAHSRVLIPRASAARDVLPETLRDAGVDVDVLPVYDTEQASAEPEADEVLALALRDELDAVTFTSSSTVKQFVSLMNEAAARAGVEPEAVWPHINAASIGPVTSRTLREYSIPCALEAQHYTIPGLVDELIHWVNEGRIDR